MVDVTPLPLCTQRKRPGTHCKRGWVDPYGRSGRVRKIASRAGIQSPDRPARSELLHRLSYRGPPGGVGRLKSHSKNFDAEDVVNFQIRNFCNNPILFGAKNNEFPAFYGHGHVPNLSQSNPAHSFTPHFFNLLKPTGHVMHQQFNIKQLYALPALYLCVLYLSENKQRLVPLTA